MKDSIREELQSKKYLQNELKQTQDQVKQSQDQIILTAVRTIQRYWKKQKIQKSRRILMQERIQKLKEIQANEKKRRSILSPSQNLIIQKVESSIPFNTNKEKAKEEVKTHLDMQALESEKNFKNFLERPDSDDQKESSENMTEQEESEEEDLVKEIDLTAQHEEEQKEFEEELNEEEIIYLQNTGRYFILDSMRQMETLFGDLHHNFVEHKIKKDRGSIFGKTKKHGNSDIESD